MGLLQIDAQKTDAFFRRLSSVAFADKADVSVVVVVHLVSNTAAFLEALSQVSRVELIVPKRNSIDPAVEREVRESFPDRILDVDDPKAWAGSASRVLSEFGARISSGSRIAIVDLGGYFAHSIDELRTSLGERLVGAVEGTENGVQRYDQSGVESVPVFSVASSPLKYPENHLVGISVAHSLEAVLREHDQVLQSKRACVIGFGRVGRSAAESLRNRGVNTVVHDRSPIALAEAAARGFHIESTLKTALSHANLVICATGNRSLAGPAFGWITDRSFVATVTSADDELELSELESGWTEETFDLRSARGSITEYRNGRAHRFFLIDHGNSVNFLHGAVIGPAIRLIEAEKLLALRDLTLGFGVAGVDDRNVISQDQRALVAKMWLEHFAVGGSV